MAANLHGVNNLDSVFVEEDGHEDEDDAYSDAYDHVQHHLLPVSWGRMGVGGVDGVVG